MTTVWRVNMSQPLLLALVLANLYALNRVRATEYQNNVPEDVITKLPLAKTTSGQSISLLKDRPMLLLILDSTDQSSEAIWSEIAAASTPPPPIVLLTQDPVATMKDAPSGASVQVVKVARDGGLAELGLPEMWNRWVLYDNRLVRRATGDPVAGGLIGALRDVAIPDAEPPAQTIARQLNGQTMEKAFSAHRARAAITASREHYMMFIDKASTSCPIATVLKQLQNASDRSDDTAFSVAVPGTWSDDEVQALKTTFSLRIPVVKVDAELTTLWRELEHIYGISQVGSFLAVVAPNGVGAAYLGATAVFRALADVGVGL